MLFAVFPHKSYARKNLASEIYAKMLTVNEIAGFLSYYYYYKQFL